MYIMISTQLTKHRTQIYLTEDQYQKVKQVARKEDTSFAEVIRHAVNKYAMNYREDDGRIAFEKDKAAFLKLAGIGEGPKDLAEHHDDYW